MRNARKTCPEERDKVSITIRSKNGDEHSVTPGIFRAWKKRAGRDTAFVLQVPGADGSFVQTWGDMQRVPPGAYEADLVQRVKLPPKLARGELKGCDTWKCV